MNDKAYCIYSLIVLVVVIITLLTFGTFMYSPPVPEKEVIESGSIVQGSDGEPYPKGGTPPRKKSGRVTGAIDTR